MLPKQINWHGKCCSGGQRKDFFHLEFTDEKIMHPAFSLKLNCQGFIPGENEVLPEADGGDMMLHMLQTMKAMTSSGKLFARIGLWSIVYWR